MRVNWRDMETEELGSVYEALLELTAPRRSGSTDYFSLRKALRQVATHARPRAAIILQTAWSSCCSTERSIL